MTELSEEQRQLAADNHNLIYGFMRDNNIQDEERFYFVFAESLCKAAGAYDPSKGRFSTLAYKYMLNDYKMELRDSAALKRKWEGEYVYLDAMIFNNDKNEKGEFIGKHNGFEDDLIESVDIERKIKSHKLSETEKIILSSRLEGMSYKEISKHYGIPRSRAINIFRKSKIKLSNHHTK